MTSLLKTSPNGNFHFPFILEAEPSIHLPTDQPTTTPSFQKVQLNFTVTNLFYSQDMKQPDTPKYQRNKRNIEDAVRMGFCAQSVPLQRLTYGHRGVRG